ncbi:aspartic peptidase domain-containing protein [Suillus spraguei]|nr:aspartic peptidase domain-containing protein [Suillus spraguei]
MFLPASLLTLLLALSIMGSPVEARNSSITIPLTNRLNFSNGTINTAQYDKAALGRRAGGISIPRGFSTYTAYFGVGKPLTVYTLIIDSCSSVTWVGAKTPYKKTDTSFYTERPVAEEYGNKANPYASFSGTIYLDTVTIGDGLTVNDFPLGVATESHNINVDGILGIGPEVLSRRTLKDDLTRTIPTYTDYLYDEGKIGHNIVSIFLQPSTADPESNFGELTFGDLDYTKFRNIVYTPVTDAPVSKDYWGVNLSITYGSTDILLRTAGIIDTGNPFIYIATDAYRKYKDVTGAIFDPVTRLLYISPYRYLVLKDLDFHIGDEIFSLTRNAQIWPRSLNYRLEGGAENRIYLIVTDLGTRSGQGHDFVNGYTFIQRFYVVLDSSSSRVGFATTRFTDAITN